MNTVLWVYMGIALTAWFIDRETHYTKPVFFIIFVSSIFLFGITLLLE